MLHSMGASVALDTFLVQVASWCVVRVTGRIKAGAGQGSAARAASLRVRIWPECPERYLSEIIWASKPDCGIATTRKALT